MAGSLKWMKYTADSGKEYAVKIDESNAELTGFVDLGPGLLGGTVGLDALPRNIKMRYVNCMHMPTGTMRKIPVGKPGLAIMQGGALQLPLYSGNTVQVVAFTVMSSVGERRRAIFGEDTGLNDGDAS